MNSISRHFVNLFERLLSAEEGLSTATSKELAEIYEEIFGAPPGPTVSENELRQIISQKFKLMSVIHWGNRLGPW